MKPDPAAGLALWNILLLAAFVIPAIFFLMTEYKTLQLIRPGNRRMMPGLVWLQLIPLFGQVWQFIVVTRIADSIKKELESPRGDSILGLSDTFAAGGSAGKPTLWLGSVYCTMNVFVIVMNLFKDPDAFVTPVAVVGLSSIGCWIVYWVTLAGYKRKLKVLAATI